MKHLLFIILIASLVISYRVYTLDRIPYNVYLGDINLSLLDRSQAQTVLQLALRSRTSEKLEFIHDKQTLNVDLPKAKTRINYTEAVTEALLVNQLQTILQRYQLSPKISFELSSQLKQLSKQIEQPPQDATIWLDAQNNITYKPSVRGIKLDELELKHQINNFIVTGNYNNALPTLKTESNFTSDEALAAKAALESVKNKPITLKFEAQKFVIDVPTLFFLLNLNRSLKPLPTHTLLDPIKLNNFLRNIANSVNIPIEEPLFKFNPGTKRVSEFRPAQAGRELEIEKTAELINSALVNNTEEIILPVKTTAPNIQTSEINKLGINELLAQGVSNFVGSIPNRIYNVGLTAARINGILVAPGETFSFVKTVGEINAETGFKQAYVIKEGRTVLDDGGGVCQVSTTLFRAALGAGLPIVDRTAHAYRVGYYEQGFPPGLDATVFYPSVDFKFKNDTGFHILIQSYVQGMTLYVDFYGTPDGRVASLTTPVVTDQTPPPPELRQDDPTLPRGQIKQVDWSAWGARVSFKRTVIKNGETIANETWRSNYKPWQAVYLVGVQ